SHLVPRRRAKAAAWYPRLTSPGSWHACGVTLHRRFPAGAQPGKSGSPGSPLEFAPYPLIEPAERIFFCAFFRLSLCLLCTGPVLFCEAESRSIARTDLAYWLVIRKSVVAF